MMTAVGSSETFVSIH